MAKKLGCGPMAVLFLLIALILIVGMNASIGLYFGKCDEDIVDCVMNATDEEEEPAEGTVTAVGTYTYKDYSVNITMNIPLGGGAVTGTVSGTCDGHVKGNYNGQGISGTLSGVCAPFFVNIPSSADFSGSVNKGAKRVPIEFNGRGAGFKHEGSMTLTYK